MRSDSKKNVSADADQNRAPSLTCVRLEFDVGNLLGNELCFPQEGVRIWNTGIISM